MLKITDYDGLTPKFWAENESENGNRFLKITIGKDGTKHYYTEECRGYVERGRDGFWAVFSTLKNGRKFYQYTLEHIERI